MLLRCPRSDFDDAGRIDINYGRGVYEAILRRTLGCCRFDRYGMVPDLASSCCCVWNRLLDLRTHRWRLVPSIE